MDALQFVLAFNLSTCIVMLIGCYVLSRRYDTPTESRSVPSINVAGVSGAVLSIGLLSGLATMFV